MIRLAVKTVQFWKNYKYKHFTSKSFQFHIIFYCLLQLERKIINHGLNACGWYLLLKVMNFGYYELNSKVNYLILLNIEYTLWWTLNLQMEILKIPSTKSLDMETYNINFKFYIPFYWFTDDVFHLQPSLTFTIHTCACLVLRLRFLPKH